MKKRMAVAQRAAGRLSNLTYGQQMTPSSGTKSDVSQISTAALTSLSVQELFPSDYGGSEHLVELDFSEPTDHGHKTVLAEA